MNQEAEFFETSETSESLDKIKQYNRANEVRTDFIFSMGLDKYLPFGPVIKKPNSNIQKKQ